MALFYDAHRRAIENGFNRVAREVGDQFQISMREPLHRPDKKVPSLTVQIIAFVRTSPSTYSPATPADEAAIADWDKRHRATDQSAFEVPDFMFPGRSG